MRLVYYHHFHVLDEWVQVQGLEGQREGGWEAGLAGHRKRMTVHCILSAHWPREHIAYYYKRMKRMHLLWPSLCYLPRGVHLWEWCGGGALDQETSFVIKSITNVSCLGPAIIFCIEKCLRVMVMAALSYISVSSPVDNLKLSDV